MVRHVLVYLKRGQVVYVKRVADIVSTTDTIVGRQS